MPDPALYGECRSACMKEWGRVNCGILGVRDALIVVAAREVNATAVAAGVMVGC